MDDASEGWRDLAGFEHPESLSGLTGWNLTGEQVVIGAAQAIQVARGAGSRGVASLLRGHVAGRAELIAGLGQLGLGAWFAAADAPSQAPVEDLDLPVLGAAD